MNDMTFAGTQEYFSAAELADIAQDRGITTFPATKRGANLWIRAKGWDASHLCRKRAGRGGGLEYHFTLLPDCLRNAIDARDMRKAVMSRMQSEALADQRKLMAIRTSALPADARKVMEARSEVLLAIDGFSVARGERRSWAIARFLDAVEAWQARQEIEARRDDGQILTPREADSLARPLMLTAQDGFALRAETLVTANDRPKGGVNTSERTVYRWFKSRDEGSVIALAPIPPKVQQPIPPAFKDFIRHYALPGKPTITEAYKAYEKECAERAGAQPLTLTLTQVKYIVAERLNPIEKMVGREGLLTLRSRMAYVTRTTDDMLPGVIYTSDGKTFAAEIADPDTNRPIRPEITTVLDVVTRKIVGISLARSENQRSVAEALRNSCIAHGICAIFYTDRGPGYRNEAMDADVSGLMGRLGITKMHAKAYGSQAKGRIERPNGTVWDRLAKRFPTYIGADMDKEAGQKIHKITRRELREFGKSRHLPSWEEFVAAAWAMVEEYNDKPHDGLPKFEDPETGKKRHMTPNEAWAAHVANGFEPVPVDPDEADDLFRPYKICTARRSQVWWNTNEYFHPALEAYHGEEVMVGYDYHQADKVWVREFDRKSGQPGKLICVAIFGGNRARYVPLTYEQNAVEKRAAGRLRRVEAKRDSIEAERDAMLMIDHQPTQVADFIDLKPAPEPVPVALAVENTPEAPVAAPVQPLRQVFRSDAELAAWALQNPDQLTANQISVLRGCLTKFSLEEGLRLSGIDTEALRTLLRAVAA